ncbi:AraC family transcriptional regulator [Jongsikchunia kroppenstedtii]|uniref:AraC family transcriptional regulator n=1 Tax=Jongsikchunia kroppenstedtii TaxID=1121721 RepID=UPI00036931CA|nr:helix-turn-helix domain-containing protein [Jongsikchunia kroppenstedtii]
MTDSAEPTSRGHLNPGAPGVHFDRFELGDDLREILRHVWLVRWQLPAGITQRQRVLSYPAFNAVFEPDGCALYPPLPHVQIRELEGASWGVGLLLRPGAGMLFSPKPNEVDTAGMPLPDAPAARVRDVLTDWSADSRGTLVTILRSWLTPMIGRLDDTARLVSAACDLAENDRNLLRAGELADAVGVTPRTLERAVRDRLGVTPKWLIECRRMQEAATTLFTAPDSDISALAADLGFADYPHFSRSYRRIIGETPKQTATAAPDR